MKKKTRKIGLIILVFFLLILVAGGFTAYHFYKYIYAPNVVEGAAPHFLKIPSGSGFDDVVEILSNEGLIIDTNSFIWVAEKKAYPERVKPGCYQLNPGMNNNELVNLLRSGKQSPVKLTFNNLRSLEQLAGKAGEVFEEDSAYIAQYLANKLVADSLGFNGSTFIAMFIPNTYEFYWNTPASKFVERMHEEYNKFWTSNRRQKAEKAGLSLVEVSTLASIVEMETQKNDEKSRIAGVYMNRLQSGMLLQADPTVIYAVGDFSIRRVLLKHTEYDSPYNTYKYKGLPPGPICMPSVSSIDAVLDYEIHDYFYFCAKEDFSGYHNFAKTLAQHNANARKFHRPLNERNIY
ncbi:MAG TPA: endolytic transglycosylase MltG [Bacteroidales bacterium]|nr:endolytic transglycosylase MltG [Bacteroidales bacterium]